MEGFMREMGRRKFYNYIPISKIKEKQLKKMKYMEVDGSIKLVQPLWNGCGGFS